MTRKIYISLHWPICKCYCQALILRKVTVGIFLVISSFSPLLHKVNLLKCPLCPQWLLAQTISEWSSILWSLAKLAIAVFCFHRWQKLLILQSNIYTGQVMLSWTLAMHPAAYIFLALDVFLARETTFSAPRGLSENWQCVPERARG